MPRRGRGAAGGRRRRLRDPRPRPRRAAGDAAPARRRPRPTSTAREAPEIRSEALLRLDLGDGQPARRSSPSAPATRSASTPTRAPTCSPSSAGSSSAACGAGWRDRAPRRPRARRSCCRTGWRSSARVRGASPRTLDRLPARRRGLPRLPRRALGRAGGRARRSARVSTADLRAWMAHERGRGLSARSLARALSAVKGFHGWLAEARGLAGAGGDRDPRAAGQAAAAAAGGAGRGARADRDGGGAEPRALDRRARRRRW